jgi:alkylhydroperoxidase family enzyme
VGRKAGITEAQLLALMDFESSPAFDAVEKLVLRYAAAMTQTPVEISDHEFEQLRGHFNEKQLVELTSAIAWENYRARFDHAFGIGAEGFSEGAYCPLPEISGRSLLASARNGTSEAE